MCVCVCVRVCVRLDFIGYLRAFELCEIFGTGSACRCVDYSANGFVEISLNQILVVSVLEYIKGNGKP